VSDKKKLYVFAKSRIKHDKFQDLRYRWSTGPGLGYRFVNDPKGWKLEAESSATWVREDRDNGERDDGYMAADLAVRGAWRIVDGLIFSFESIWAQSLKESRDYIGDSYVALDLKIIQDLSITAKMVWEYENETPPGVEHNDWTYLLGVTWTAFCSTRRLPFHPTRGLTSPSATGRIAAGGSVPRTRLRFLVPAARGSSPARLPAHVSIRPGKDLLACESCFPSRCASGWPRRRLW